MNRRKFTSLAGALIGASACSRSESSRPIRVAAGPYFSISSLHLANDGGHFAKEGLSVEIEHLSGEAQAIALVAGGGIDVAFVSIRSALVNAVARGAELRIVAGREYTNPACSDLGTVYGRRSVFPDGLDDLTVLRGKRVASYLDAGVALFSVDTMLGSVGLTAEELSLRNMARSESVPALLKGTIDAVLVSDFRRTYPQVADQIVRGPSLSDVLPDFQFAFIVYGPYLLSEEREAGARFLRAYFSGARDFLAGETPRFLEELAANSGIDPEAARMGCRNSFYSDGRISVNSLERFIGWARKRGFCPKEIDAAAMIDSWFLAAATDSASGDHCPTPLIEARHSRSYDC